MRPVIPPTRTGPVSFRRGTHPTLTGCLGPRRRTGSSHRLLQTTVMATPAQAWRFTARSGRLRRSLSLFRPFPSASTNIPSVERRCVLEKLTPNCHHGIPFVWDVPWEGAIDCERCGLAGALAERAFHVLWRRAAISRNGGPLARLHRDGGGLLPRRPARLCVADQNRRTRT